MKKAALVYGLGGGMLIIVLRLAEYPFLVVEHSVEIYGALVASLFADNPLMNAAITFTEPFPIGLVVTLISAAVLRKK